jgi:hypothetical protein
MRGSLRQGVTPKSYVKMHLPPSIVSWRRRQAREAEVATYKLRSDQ